VNAEFNVWLLIVGLVVGAGLVWLVMMDGRRREIDIDEVELPREAAWISALLAEDGYDVSPEAAEQALLLHRAYLGAPPPDLAPAGRAASEPAPAGRAAGEPAAGDPAPAPKPEPVSEANAPLSDESMGDHDDRGHLPPASPD
jgi:hypothetical protein